MCPVAVGGHIPFEAGENTDPRMAHARLGDRFEVVERPCFVSRVRVVSDRNRVALERKNLERPFSRTG